MSINARHFKDWLDEVGRMLAKCGYPHGVDLPDFDWRERHDVGEGPNCAAMTYISGHDKWGNETP